MNGARVRAVLIEAGNASHRPHRRSLRHGGQGNKLPPRKRDPWSAVVTITTVAT